jgi:hypothetical protein
MHMSHWKGRILSWIRRCVDNVDDRLKVFPHLIHQKGEGFNGIAVTVSEWDTSSDVLMSLSAADDVRSETNNILFCRQGWGRERIASIECVRWISASLFTAIMRKGDPSYKVALFICDFYIRKSHTQCTRKELELNGTLGVKIFEHHLWIFVSISIWEMLEKILWLIPWIHFVASWDFSYQKS